MPDVTVICVGKMKEKFFSDACDEYAKRLSAFCKFSYIEIQEHTIKGNVSDNSIINALNSEAVMIEKNIPKDAYVIAMCIEGEKTSSEGLSERIKKIMLEGRSKICFIIGGSFGLSDSVKKMADYKLSMSDMTFPHHLARVMVSEQIYRAFSILEGTKYHK